MGEVGLSEPGPEDALVEPVLVGWEGNCYHAVQRRPLDIARARGEEQIVLGNSGVVRVLRPPLRPTHETLREGDLCLVQANVKPDRFGYGTNGAAFGYDAPGTVGLLARRTVIPGSCLVPLPESSLYSVRAVGRLLHPVRHRLGQLAGRLRDLAPAGDGGGPARAVRLGLGRRNDLRRAHAGETLRCRGDHYHLTGRTDGPGRKARSHCGRPPRIPRYRE